MRRGMALGVAVIGLAAATPATAAARGPVPLKVTNDNFYDVHVYGWRDGEYHSLGVVRSFSTEKLEVPEYLAAPGGDFRLIADPIGGLGAYASDPIVVREGGTLVMRVENSLNLSTVVIQ